MDSFFGEMFEENQFDQLSDDSLVLSIDTKNEFRHSDMPLVGLTWSKEVFDYLYENMSVSRIEKFLEDSFNASYEKYLQDIYKRTFNA